MRILLYFGSFNPIHYGHLRLAEYVLNNGDIDELWFVLSLHNPLKSPADLWPEQRRLSLVRQAIDGKNGLKACDVEFSLPKPNYTINTLRHLSAQYPQHTFSILIGEDNYNIFDRWRDWQDIIRNWHIYVYPREGTSSDRNRFPQMQWLDQAPHFNISSTEIRQRLSKGEPVDELTPVKI